MTDSARLWYNLRMRRYTKKRKVRRRPRRVNIYIIAAAAVLLIAAAVVTALILSGMQEQRHPLETAAPSPGPTPDMTPSQSPALSPAAPPTEPPIITQKPPKSTPCALSRSLYQITAEYLPQSRSIKVIQQIEFVNRTGAELYSIRLWLGTDEAYAYEFESVSVNKAYCDYTLGAEQMHIPLYLELLPDCSIDLQLEYTVTLGEPAGKTLADLDAAVLVAAKFADGAWTAETPQDGEYSDEADYRVCLILPPEAVPDGADAKLTGEQDGKGYYYIGAESALRLGLKIVRK